jgi:lia operon protein LiaF
MKNRGELYLGGALVLVGLLLTLGSVLRVSVAVFVWPLAFILLGVWFIVRPRSAPGGRAVTMKILGDVKRRGQWAVADEEIWLLIGDIDLDLSQAQVPPGETRLSAYGFVGDVELTVPEDVGLRIRSTAFVSDSKVLGGKEESFIAPYRYITPGYDTMPRRLSLDTVHFVCDLRVRAS